MKGINSKLIVVLMPIHNGIVFTKKCLNSLHESLMSTSNPKYRVEIVVIDDGSTDDSLNLISLKWPSVHIVKGDGNLWWSGSINAGIRFGMKRFVPDFFLLINNDCLVERGFFEKIIFAIENHRKGTILISKVYDLSMPRRVFSMGAKFDPFWGLDHIISEKFRNKYDMDEDISVDWCGGMGVLIPKCVFIKIGFFDVKNFPQYKGDFDFFLRAKKNGFQLIACPDLEVWNDIKQSGFKVIDMKTFLRSFIDKRSQVNIFETSKFYTRHCYFGICCLGFIYRYIKHVSIGLKTILKKIV